MSEVQNKTRILFFVNSFCGGAEKMTTSIARNLDIAKYEVNIVVYNSSRHNDIYNFIPDYISVTKIDWGNSCDILIKIVRLLKVFRPDVVFCSMMQINNYLILAAKIVGGIKVVIRNNNMLSDQRRNKKNYFLSKYVYRHADIVIAQTEEMEQDLHDLLGVPKSKLKVIHNPVDIELIKCKANVTNPYDNEFINYTYVARFTPNKGQDILIKAFSLLANRIPNARLYLVGKLDESNYLKSVKNLVDECKLTEKVIFTGFQDNPYVWIKNADCFVLPSRIEGLPNVLLESLSLGTPVVATRSIPIIERIVNHGINGFVVNVEDYYQMANAMEKALELKDIQIYFKCSKYEDFEQVLNK